jgi:hypothetical protein
MLISSVASLPTAKMQHIALVDHNRLALGNLALDIFGGDD